MVGCSKAAVLRKRGLVCGEGGSGGKCMGGVTTRSTSGRISGGDPPRRPDPDNDDDDPGRCCSDLTVAGERDATERGRAEP